VLWTLTFSCIKLNGHNSWPDNLPSQQLERVAEPNNANDLLARGFAFCTAYGAACAVVSQVVSLADELVADRPFACLVTLTLCKLKNLICLLLLNTSMSLSAAGLAALSQCRHMKQLVMAAPFISKGPLMAANTQVGTAGAVCRPASRSSPVYAYLWMALLFLAGDMHHQVDSVRNCFVC
jgi:hypothetical protein